MVTDEAEHIRSSSACAPSKYAQVKNLPADASWYFLAPTRGGHGPIPRSASRTVLDDRAGYSVSAPPGGAPPAASARSRRRRRRLRCTKRATSP